MLKDQLGATMTVQSTAPVHSKKLTNHNIRQYPHLRDRLGTMTDQFTAPVHNATPPPPQKKPTLLTLGIN